MPIRPNAQLHRMSLNHAKLLSTVALLCSRCSFAQMRNCAGCYLRSCSAMSSTHVNMYSTKCAIAQDVMLLKKLFCHVSNACQHVFGQMHNCAGCAYHQRMSTCIRPNAQLRRMCCIAMHLMFVRPNAQLRRMSLNKFLLFYTSRMTFFNSWSSIA